VGALLSNASWLEGKAEWRYAQSRFQSFRSDGTILKPAKATKIRQRENNLAAEELGAEELGRRK
jgi:hypothetical protein